MGNHEQNSKKKMELINENAQIKTHEIQRKQNLRVVYTMKCLKKKKKSK